MFVCVCKVGNMSGLRDNGSLVAEKNYRVPFKVISVKLTLKHLCSITYTVNLSFTLSVTYYYLSLICRHSFNALLFHFSLTSSKTIYYTSVSHLSVC